ncbi:MAG: hypothetical protein CMQ40_07250 [Gammaproteobacteria bacterium]|nr:hypothetical protein [Gammaproteobacteria bacterium]
MSNSLGIIVNPFAGRDVRRIAAKASLSEHHEKSQQVTRLVLGALSVGVQQIFVGDDPFRIGEKATKNLPERNMVEMLDYKFSHSAKDTVRIAEKMWEKGCKIFLVLGGDGTCRIVAKYFPDSTLLPLSTGTNNVFPYRIEASVAGMAAGFIATGKIEKNSCQRCKLVHMENNRLSEIALVDAVLLKGDSLGNLLPIIPENICQIFLARSDPAAVGISPIGGASIPAGHEDNFGVLIRCDKNSENRIKVAVSPGLHRSISIKTSEKIELGKVSIIRGPGILACDGDRVYKLGQEEMISSTIRRDGPRIIEPEKTMSLASRLNLFNKLF